MTENNQIEICVDRVLPEDLRIPAAERSVAENFTNQPTVHFSPGLGVAPLSPFELAALTAKKWNNGRVLRVRFLDGDQEVQNRLQPFAHQWSEHAHIKLEFGDDPDAEIRISFQHSGSWSYLGTDSLSIPRDEPTMNFGWLTPNSSDDEYSRVVIHEFGHALGCYHEHQNPITDIPWDKEAVYAYYAGPPNNWSKAKVDNNLFHKYSKNVSQYSIFDVNSIMLYSIPNSLTIGDFEVGWNRVLSDTDKSFIAKMYPKDEKDMIELTIDASGTKASIGEHGEEDIYQFIVEQKGMYRIQTSGWTDVVMTLSGPDDETHQIAMDDDSGFFRNARIDVSLKIGTYYVRVRHYRPRRTGKYKIGVNKLE